MDFDGRNQLITLPYFVRSQGVLSGLDLSTDSARIFQSLVEGISYEFRSILEASVPLFQEPIRTIHSGGGGSKAAKWLQLKANVAQITVRKVSNPEISTLGAAVIAATSLSVYGSLEEAVSNLVNLENTYTPQTERYERYDARFERYRQLQRSENSPDEQVG